MQDIMARAYQTIELEHQHEWLTVWLNRPASRNALSAAMVGELLEVLEAIAPDRAIRGVTLRGRGGVFCAGADLAEFKATMADATIDAAAVARNNRNGGRLFQRINSLPQVVVALVEGAAMAGGLGMACCADIVAVTEDAQFALTETTLGIPPAQIAPFLADRLGLPAARRLMLTGVRFRGPEALQLRLADYVVPDVEGLARIEADIRANVRRCAPGANASTKEILLASRQLDRVAMLDFAAECFARCLLGDEGREGITAFMEKRKPAWAEPVTKAES
jgi:isohexenylglutaconyl-CoA hydratase